MRRIFSRWLWMGAVATAVAAHAAPVRVVTTIFPLTDWTRAVGGDRALVTQLLPPGVEAHSFAPKPSDVFRVQKADVFVYLGPDMEPWAAGLLRAARRPERVDLEAGRNVERAKDEDHEEEEQEHEQGETEAEESNAEHHAHAHGETDPHIWLDPVLAQTIVRDIAEALAAADPEGADTYRRNAETYVGKLQALHEKIAEGLKNAKHREILYGGHFAFGYFARRYGLGHRSPYRGFSPNAAPTPRAIADLIRTLKDSGQTTIFHEELLDPSVARVIAEQTGARLVLLHGAHNLSKEDAERGDLTYISIMERNLQRLREGLGAP